MLYSLVATLTDFPALKNFENRLRFDEIIATVYVRVLYLTEYTLRCPYCVSDIVHGADYKFNDMTNLY